MGLMERLIFVAFLGIIAYGCWMAVEAIRRGKSPWIPFLVASNPLLVLLLLGGGTSVAYAALVNLLLSAVYHIGVKRTQGERVSELR